MLELYQRCSNAIGWTVIAVESASEPGVLHNVTLSDHDDYLCDCKGYRFNGICRHKKIAESLRCNWEEGISPCQDDIERRGHICPVCGSNTVIVVERVNDHERT